MGASSGIGHAVADALASRGVMVGLAARHTSTLKELKEKYPDFVEYEAIDINQADATGKMSELIEKLGGMDIYFHVSGIGYDNPSFDPEREADIINTNACGFARMTSAAYSYFRKKRKRGQIVAVTSVAGTKGIAEYSAYSASKRCASTYLTALDQLSRKELAGISITDIRPGWISTPLLHSDTEYPMEMTLDYVVPQIIRAIVKHPRVAYIDWRWGLLCSLWQLIPNCIWSRLDLKITKPKQTKIK